MSYEFCTNCSDVNKIVSAEGVCNLNCQTGKVLVNETCYDCINLCEVCPNIEYCSECMENAS